ncbi:MAG TPA: hypothetical protein HA262_04405 [Methanosarcina sp.]|jgi:hypothetical protein|nr:hypothetical protein [Methanosarcina sp.]
MTQDSILFYSQHMLLSNPFRSSQENGMLNRNPFEKRLDRKPFLKRLLDRKPFEKRLDRKPFEKTA